MSLYLLPTLLALALSRRTSGLHCTRCWYEVQPAGVESLPARCPECGADLTKRNAAIGARLAMPNARIWIGVALGSAWGLIALWHGVRDYL